MIGSLFGRCWGYFDLKAPTPLGTQQGPVKKVEVLIFKWYLTSLLETFCLCVLQKDLVDWPVQIQLKNALANQNASIRRRGRHLN